MRASRQRVNRPLRTSLYLDCCWKVPLTYREGFLSLMCPAAHLLVGTTPNQVDGDDKQPQLTWCFPEYSCLSIAVVQHSVEPTKHPLIIFFFKKILLWARQTAQQLEFATLLEDLGLIPSTCIRWLRATCNHSSRGFYNISWPLHGTCTHVHIPTHRYTQVHIIKTENKY